MLFVIFHFSISVNFQSTFNLATARADVFQSAPIVTKPLAENFFCDISV
jgi:hypothetical protein